MIENRLEAAVERLKRHKKLIDYNVLPEYLAEPDLFWSDHFVVRDAFLVSREKIEEESKRT